MPKFFLANNATAKLHTAIDDTETELIFKEISGTSGASGEGLAYILWVVSERNVLEGENFCVPLTLTNETGTVFEHIVVTEFNPITNVAEVERGVDNSDPIIWGIDTKIEQRLNRFLLETLFYGAGGDDAKCLGFDNSINIGGSPFCQVGVNSILVSSDKHSSPTGENSITIGSTISNAAEKSIRIGEIGGFGSSLAINSIGIGYALSTNSSAIRAVAIGDSISVEIENSVCIGKEASALDDEVGTETGPIAIGEDVEVFNNNIGIGQDIVVGAAYQDCSSTIAIGFSLTVNSTETIIIGGIKGDYLGINASDFMIGIGKDIAGNSSPYTVLIGYGATSHTGQNNVVVGKNATVNGANNSVCIGPENTTYAGNIVIIGSDNAGGDSEGAILIGSSISGMSALQSVLIGKNVAGNGAEKSILIGENTTTGNNFVVILGTKGKISTDLLSHLCLLPAHPNTTSLPTLDTGDIATRHRAAPLSTLSTGIIDLTDATDFYEIEIPTGSTFFPDRIDVIILEADTPSGGSAIQAGIDDGANINSIMPAQTVTVDSVNNRVCFSTPVIKNGVEVIRISVETADTGTTLNCRVVVLGYFLEDE